MKIYDYLIVDRVHPARQELEMAKKQGIDISQLGKYIPSRQWLYRFDNNYGASVILGRFNPFSDGEQLELAVTYYGEGKNDLEYELTYSTPITSDIERFDNWDQVYPVLEEIKNLDTK